VEGGGEVMGAWARVNGHLYRYHHTTAIGAGTSRMGD
jgi:hypothetical protein